MKCSDKEEYIIAGCPEKRRLVKVFVKGLWKVAFEQWTEPWYIRYHAVSSNVISTLQESSIVSSVLAECRE